MGALRKQDEHRQRLTWPTLESMEHAAGVLHFTLEEIKLCKKSGSKAFLSGSRIDSIQLIQDLHDLLHAPKKLPEGFDSWKEFGESRRALIADEELKQTQKITMQVAEAEMQASQAMAFLFGELERIARETPPAIAGLDAVSVHKRLNSDIGLLRKNLERKFQEIGK